MKKIIFSLLATIAILSSCSSDDNLTFPNGGNNGEGNETKSYPVNFTIKTDVEVTVNPLSRAGYNYDPSDPFRDLDLAIYKESGEIYLKTADLKQYITPVNPADPNMRTGFTLSLDLPEGKYYVAFAYYMELFKWEMNNYFTDKIVNQSPGQSIGFGVYGREDNFCLFYESLEFTVSANSTNNVPSTVLRPMFSQIQVEVDLSELIYPAGTARIECTFNPACTSLNIKDKIATDVLQSETNFNFNQSVKIDPNDNTKGTLSFVSSKTIDTNNDIKLLFKFVDVNNNVIEEKTYPVNSKLENGHNYIIRGKLTSNATNSSSGLSITFKKFDKDNPITLTPQYN